MNWLEQFAGQISFVELMLKGLAIGVIVSAPLGPVGVMCIRRTLNKGRWHGFITGMGASLSDLFYAMVTGLGMSFVFDFINNAHNMFVLQLVGSILLFIFGIHTFRTNPNSYRTNPMDKLGSYPVTKSKLAYNFATGFALAIGNPLIIIMFVALFARMSFVLTELGRVEHVMGYISVWVGAVAWWFGITWLVSKLGARFDVRGIWLLNRIIGAVVMVFGVVGVGYTLL